MTQPAQPTNEAPPERLLPPLPPVRRRRLPHLGLMILIAFIAVFVCLPLSFFGRSAVMSAYLKQGDDALFRNQFEEARANYNSAMDWSGASEKPFSGRLTVARMTGDVDLAIADYSAVIANHPENPYPYCYRADLYRSQGKDDLALADYRSCLQYEPSAEWKKGSLNSIENMTR